MFGPYEIRTLLGAGGMGEVYQAFDTARDRVVALKLLRLEFATDTGFEEPDGQVVSEPMVEYASS